MIALITCLSFVQVGHALQSSQGVRTSAAKLPLTGDQVHGSSFASNVETSDCDGTVAYVFLVVDSIPLASVWSKYFGSCPKGSHTVLVHAQNQNAQLSKHVHSMGAKQIDPKQVVAGDLRFNFSMVQAELNLYEGVRRDGNAPNGCKPRWIHLSSESCAPVAPCSQVHEHLKQHRYGSFVGYQVQEGPRNLGKSSQWVTLWSDHAFALAADQKAIRKFWGYRQHGFAGIVFEGSIFRGALDEFVFANTIRKKKFLGQEFLGTLTGSLWPAANVTTEGHPKTISAAADAKHTIDSAKVNGKLFLRKFEATPSVIKLLESYVAPSQYSTEWLDEFSCRDTNGLHNKCESLRRRDTFDLAALNWTAYD